MDNSMDSSMNNSNSMNQISQTSQTPQTPAESEQGHPLLQFSSELSEEKVTKRLKEMNASWDSYANNLYPKMKSWHNMYRNMETNVEGVATKIPEVFCQIETEIPHLLNSIYSHSQMVDAAPKFQDPQGVQTYKVKSYINKLIKDICSGRSKTELIIKNMLIFGWSVTKMYWNTDADHDVDPDSKEVVSVNSAHPDFYMVDPFAFAFDPNYEGQNIDEVEWVRERVFISKNKLKQMRDNDECAPFNDDDMSGTDDKDKGKEVRNKSSEIEKEKGKTYYDEFWCVLYEKDQEGKTVSQKYRCWLLGNNKIIKFEKNLFERKPYAICRSYSNPNEFLGVGEPEVIGAISSQISMVHYQSGKMVKKVGQNLTFVDPSAGISPQNLKRIEQGVLFVNNINGIKSEQSTDPQNIQVLVKYQEYLDSKVQQITGIGPTLRGDIQGDITATQASIANQNASNRLAGKLVHIQEDFVKPLAEIFFMMNKQLLQVPVQFFDTNNNLIELSPDDFNGNYTWMPVGTISQSNKALQLQQNQELLQGLLGMAQASMQTPTPFTVDIPYYIAQHLAPYANIPDIQNIIKPTSPPPPPPPPLPPPPKVSVNLKGEDIQAMGLLPTLLQEFGVTPPTPPTPPTPSAPQGMGMTPQGPQDMGMPPQGPPPSPANSPNPSSPMDQSSQVGITNPSLEEMQPIEPAANLGRGR